MKPEPNIITQKLLSWYDREKRSFVFRGTRDPYRIWLSEMMLQQTRTETVEPYYLRFLAAFPDVFALARASQEEVLKLWEGLGYYARARNLHKAAQLVAGERGGVFPKTAKDLQALPGVGPYASAAIASIAYDQPIPAMDGNLRRVISRLFLVQEDITIPRVQRHLQDLGQRLMPETRGGDMNQALMDLGASICLPANPSCQHCPLAGDCMARQEGKAQRLPILPTKKAPVSVPVAVGIIIQDGKVLLQKRQAALLKGMYVFLLHEGADSGQALLASAHQLGLHIGDLQELGQARHIFTHRIWQMRIYTARLLATPASQESLVFADSNQLKSLPLPKAMARSKEWALELLNGSS